MYAHWSLLYPACILILFIFWCFWRWKQSLSSLTFHSLEALKWLSWAGTTEAFHVLSDILEWGPSVSSFPQGFQVVLKNASKLPPSPVSEVTWGATQDGRCEHSPCQLSGDSSSPGHPPKTFEIKGSGFLSFAKVNSRVCSSMTELGLKYVCR